MARWIVRFGFAMVLLSLPAMAGGEVLPRYALRPGQVLDYEEREDSRAAEGDFVYVWRSRVWVVDGDEDGAARVVVKQVLTMERKDALADAAAEDDLTSFARFDIQPNGAIPFSPSRDSRVDASAFLPRLPDDAKAVAEGWRSRDDRDDKTIAYKRVASDEGDENAAFTFEADQSSYLERVYEGRSLRVFHFDRDRGLVVRAETARTLGKGSDRVLKGTLELKSVTAMAPAELAVFRGEMDRYFEALQAYRDALRRTMKAGDGVEGAITRARTILVDARAKVTLADPVAAIDENIENHDKFAKYYIEDARRFAKLLGKPAPGWGSIETPNATANRILNLMGEKNAAAEVKDLDGRPHSLAKYRGKVLVLDFWYRHCGWCMRAMPQVKKLADHYRDQPVAVFGVNNDQDEKDARFVVQVMNLDYPVIRSMDLPERYGVPGFGFPTLVIIDQEGKVADIHVGYSPQLFERVCESVDRLLKPAE